MVKRHLQSSGTFSRIGGLLGLFAAFCLDFLTCFFPRVAGVEVHWVPLRGVANPLFEMKIDANIQIAIEQVGTIKRAPGDLNPNPIVQWRSGRNHPLFWSLLRAIAPC